MGNWFSEGKRGEDLLEIEEERRLKELTKPREFWLKAGTSGRVIFLDSDGLI